MSYPIIDTHTHLYFSQFDENISQVIEDCQNANVTHQVQIGCDEISSLAAIELARKNDGFFATIGLHPCDVAPLFEKNFSNNRIKNFEDYERQCFNLDQLFAWFETLYKQEKDTVVGLGETGFDRYHDDRDDLVQWQTQAFGAHVEMAEQYDLPIVIHSRASNDELLGFMKKNIRKNKHRGVVHCFAEGIEMADIITKEYGFFIGIGGVSTYDNAKKLQQAIIQTPIEFLVTETDSPFLAPKKFKKTNGRINNASSIQEIIQNIARLKNMNEAFVGHQLFENGKRLYRI
jgi:TatD DNase family protein